MGQPYVFLFGRVIFAHITLESEENIQTSYSVILRPIHRFLPYLGLRFRTAICVVVLGRLNGKGFGVLCYSPIIGLLLCPTRKHGPAYGDFDGLSYDHGQSCRAL